MYYIEYTKRIEKTVYKTFIKQFKTANDREYYYNTMLKGQHFTSLKMYYKGV